MNEGNQFLLEEEAVPVKFVKELRSLGFVVSQEDSTADIPIGYKANIPFWLAKDLASIGVVEIEQPKWLAELNSMIFSHEELKKTFFLTTIVCL